MRWDSKDRTDPRPSLFAHSLLLGQKAATFSTSPPEAEMRGRASADCRKADRMSSKTQEWRERQIAQAARGTYELAQLFLALGDALLLQCSSQ